MQNDFFLQINTFSHSNFFFLAAKQLKYSFNILWFKNIIHKDQQACFHSVVPDITHHTRQLMYFLTVFFLLSDLVSFPRLKCEALWLIHLL